MKEPIATELPTVEPDAPGIAIAGAVAFGLVVGWFVYHVNRHRREEAKLTDVVGLIGAVGGAAVLALFPSKSSLFGGYGLGLAMGFFLYFIVLVMMVRRSENFDYDWFLDGRRKDPKDGTSTDGTRPMGGVAETPPIR
jgi:hypothetical protein